MIFEITISDKGSLAYDVLLVEAESMLAAVSAVTAKLKRRKGTDAGWTITKAVLLGKLTS